MTSIRFAMLSVVRVRMLLPIPRPPSATAPVGTGGPDRPQ
jgi:hypothetical protein